MKGVGESKFHAWKEIGTVCFWFETHELHKGFNSPRMACLEWSGHCLERFDSLVYLQWAANHICYIVALSLQLHYTNNPVLFACF